MMFIGFKHKCGLTVLFQPNITYDTALFFCRDGDGISTMQPDRICMVVKVMDPVNVLEDHSQVSGDELVNELWTISFQYSFIESE